MEATTAQANELERRVDLSIAIADVEKEMEQRLKRMGKNMKMPGFRPGKVPFSIVKQQYGDQARHEVLSEELDRVFGETVTEKKMRLAGMLGHDAVQLVLDGQDFPGMDGDIRSLALKAAQRLVDHHARVGKGKTLALGAGTEQEGAHRGSLADT